MLRQFNPDMLALARDLRGFTQAELVHGLGSAMSQAKLSKIENGLAVPTDEEVAALARALAVEPQFLRHPHLRRSEPATYHRKRQKLTNADWARVYARAELLRIATALLMKSVDLRKKLPALPYIDPDDFGGKIEHMASAMRQLWLLPRGPIADLCSLLESAGVVVFAFDFGTELSDGFSQHAVDGMPACIFVNARQPKDRMRFTLAHEMAHLILHRMPNPEMETQANRFAGAFLMPENELKKDLYRLSLEQFMMLKMHWKVSMQAIIMRAFHLGRLTEDQYRYYFSQMTKRGWKSSEPVEIDPNIERPRVLRQLVEAHISHLSYTLGDLASLIGLGLEETADLLQMPNRPRLRVVG